MKKLFFIGGFALLSLASCKKDYSCSCTDTDNYGGITSTEVYTYKVEGATKQQAQAACNEAIITYTFGSDFYKTECKLSK